MLNFKEWFYEAKHPAVVNTQVKKWIDSAEKLKQTIEKLKAILKSKKTEEKPAEKPTEKPTKPEKKPEKKPFGKSTDEEEPEEKEPEKTEKLEKKPTEKQLEPKIKKIVPNPTKVDKKGKDLNNNVRRS